MNEEHLNEALRVYEEKIHYIDFKDVQAAFKAGARWHESLPLAERLTDREKMAIKMRYEVAKGLCVSDPDRKEYYRSQWETLETIFGKNLFTPTEQ